MMLLSAGRPPLRWRCVANSDWGGEGQRRYPACALTCDVCLRNDRHLYQDSLGYTLIDTERGYYADGEDALDLRLAFGNYSFGKKGGGKEAAAAAGDEAVAGGAQGKTQ